MCGYNVMMFVVMLLCLVYLWTKFVVPSTGSMSHVGSSVRVHGSPAATDSSPMKL